MRTKRSMKKNMHRMLHLRAEPMSLSPRQLMMIYPRIIPIIPQREVDAPALMVVLKLLLSVASENMPPAIPHTRKAINVLTTPYDKGRKQVPQEVNEVYVDENCSDEPPDLSIMHVRAKKSSKGEESVSRQLQKISIRVCPVDAVSCHNDEHHQNDHTEEHRQRQTGPSWAESIHQHIPVVLLTRVLQLPTSRHQQHFFFLRQLQLFRSNGEVHASPRHWILFLPLPLLSVLTGTQPASRFGLSIILVQVAESANVHYKQFSA